MKGNDMEQMNKSNAAFSVAFTGHRFISFERQKTVKERLRHTIANLYHKGYRNFLCGMAIGFDTIAAEVVLELKDEYKDIRLVAVVPFRGQCERWSVANQMRYAGILSKADDMVVLSEYYYNGCLLKRNDYLIHQASKLIAYYDGSPKGGTFYTYRKAQTKGIGIVNLY